MHCWLYYHLMHTAAILVYNRLITVLQLTTKMHCGGHQIWIKVVISKSLSYRHTHLINEIAGNAYNRVAYICIANPSISRGRISVTYELSINKFAIIVSKQCFPLYIAHSNTILNCTNIPMGLLILFNAIRKSLPLPKLPMLNSIQWWSSNSCDCIFILFPTFY